MHNNALQSGQIHSVHKKRGLRGLCSELELEAEWESADPGSVEQFEQAVALVLKGKSRFEYKPK